LDGVYHGDWSIMPEPMPVASPLNLNNGQKNGRPEAAEVIGEDA
jgi:hypothetical protein